MNIIHKRLRLIILFLILGIIGLNVFFYNSFYQQQIENRKVVINKQISITSEQIESIFQRFKNDLSFYFTYEDVENLFREKSMESRPVRKIRQFFIKYNDFLKDITVIDMEGNQFEFNGTIDNYFQKRYLKSDKELLVENDTSIQKFIPTGFELVIRIVDQGVLKANIRLTIDIQQFIKQTFEQNYITRHTLEALCDAKGSIIIANFLPSGEGFSESELISEKIGKGLASQFNNNLSIENQKLNLISVVYPVKILDYNFGLVFSEDTKSIFSEVLSNSIALSLFTIILFISIILVFVYVLNELKENEIKLTLANIELEQITIISNHDLQEPLRKIQVFSNRLLQLHIKHGDEKTITYLDKILSFANRMQLLLEEVLTYSFINQKNISRQKVDLNKVAETVKLFFDAKIKESGAVLEIGPLPTIEGNENYLKKLFENLISNSLKFAQPTVIPVIKIHSNELKRNINIYLEDNGIGIEEQYFEKIFKPFQRLSNNDGMGMGLSICKKVIDFHKGSITIKSEVNKGTIFIITLPKRQKQFSFFKFINNSD